MERLKDLHTRRQQLYDAIVRMSFGGFCPDDSELDELVRLVMAAPRYQIAFYDPGPECWRHHRMDYKLVTFDSLEEAEREARRLSQESNHAGQPVVVLTVHSCFKTVTEYPKVAPIHHTTRVALEWDTPVTVRCDACGEKPGWLTDQQRSQVAGEVCAKYGCYGILREVTGEPQSVDAVDPVGDDAAKTSTRD